MSRIGLGKRWEVDFGAEAPEPAQTTAKPVRPHPRWPQAKERILGTNVEPDTLLYNEIGEFVAGMYNRDAL